MGTPSPNGEHEVRIDSGADIRRHPVAPGGPIARSAALRRCIAPAVLAVAISSGGCGDTSGPPMVDDLEIVESAASGSVGSASTVLVEARDGSGSPIAGALLKLATATGSGLVTPTEGVTGTDGRLTASWILGTTAGDQTLHIETNGTERDLVASAQAQAPVSVVVISGDGQTGAVGDPLLLPIVLESRDRYENPSGGAALTLSVESGGLYST